MQTDLENTFWKFENMDKNQMLSDLGYLKTLAESGQKSPLLGGRIGLMWTVLLVPTLIANGLVQTGIIQMQPQYIGLLWMCFGVLGGEGSLAHQKTKVIH